MSPYAYIFSATNPQLIPANEHLYRQQIQRKTPKQETQNNARAQSTRVQTYAQTQAHTGNQTLRQRGRSYRCTDKLPASPARKK